MQASRVDIDATIEESDSCSEGHHNNNDTEDNAEKVFSQFLSVSMATAIFLRAAATVALITDLRLCPKQGGLIVWAMTCNRYRSLPHLNRQVPLSGYLMSSNSEGQPARRPYLLGVDLTGIEQELMRGDAEQRL